MAYDFPSSPTTGQSYQGYVYDGEKWLNQATSTIGNVRYDIAQGLTPAQTSQARANVNVTKKNYIVNGGMQISQENGTTASSIAASYYPVDCFYTTSPNTTGVKSSAQVASQTPGGSYYRIRVVCTTADASVGTNDNVQIVTAVEGFRMAELSIGTASAKTVTLQFGVKAPAGTYCVSFGNYDANRSYVAEYVISAGEANTNVVRSITFTLDTTGTWLGSSTGQLWIYWGLMVGTSARTSANSWVAGSFGGTSNQFNFMGTVNNTFELFDVSLTEGNVAPPFQLPDYATELALCQRYFNAIRTTNFFSVSTTANGATLSLSYPPLRANPSIASLPWTNANYVAASPTTGGQWTLMVPGFGYASKSSGTFVVSVSGANEITTIINFAGAVMSIPTIVMQNGPGQSPVMINARL